MFTSRTGDRPKYTGVGEVCNKPSMTGLWLCQWPFWKATIGCSLINCPSINGPQVSNISKKRKGLMILEPSNRHKRWWGVHICTIISFIGPKLHYVPALIWALRMVCELRERRHSMSDTEQLVSLTKSLPNFIASHLQYESHHVHHYHYSHLNWFNRVKGVCVCICVW